MKLPIPRNPIQSSKNNITYHTLQKFDFTELKRWILDLREELLATWTKNNIPPSIGRDKAKIINGFSKLNSYNVEKLWIEDENYPSQIGFIKNFSKLASPINQFFPFMLKTKIKGKSVYDWFSDENLELMFVREIVRAVRFDKMYSFSKYLDEDFSKWYKKTNHENIGYWLEPQIREPSDGRTFLTIQDTKKLLKNKILEPFDFRNEVKIVGDEKTIGYKIRVYEKHQKVFPNIIQVFRLGFGQVAVNFPPLTSRLIYEKIFGEVEQEKYKIYDPCAGWGGRLLGALCSKKQIHYIGTEVNMNNKGCYERLGEFYNKNCGGSNTYEFYYEGAEEIHKNKKFKLHQGQIDLVFTSPPYFDREVYDIDKTQSSIRFPIYSDWLDGFMKPMISTSYQYLKSNRYMLLNISDIKKNEIEYIPLEQDTIELATNIGFQYVGSVGMVMARSVGLSTKDVKNSYFDESTMSDYKTEPILVFHKE